MPRMREAIRPGWNGSMLIKLFARADEFDGLSGNGLDGQGRAAAGVAV